ncbi:MAG: NlpC/P60 family protein [Synechococcus sp.]
MTQLFQSVASLDLFETARCDRLSNQVWSGRFFHVLDMLDDGTAHVELLEDGYRGFLAANVLTIPGMVAAVDRPPMARPAMAREEIELLLPQVMVRAQRAREVTNIYLWGGNIGPNFDCSGLVQRSFTSAGIWVPRDSYQQAEFCQPMGQQPPLPEDFEQLQPGDLLFFQFGQRVDHVAIYWGNGGYLHSSGSERGHNGIAWDTIYPAATDTIACTYRDRICQLGRVDCSLAFPAIDLSLIPA